MVQITDQLLIPDREISCTVSRSSGPGGQHVNKTSTRVTLRFDVLHSPSLSPSQKDLLVQRLGSRISQEGIFQVSCEQSRSQVANRRQALDRFVTLLRGALQEKRPRKRTRPTAAGRERRLRYKKHRSRVKKERKKKNWQEE